MNKFITTALLLLAVALLCWGAWQWRQSAQEDRVSDGQMEIKPEIDPAEDPQAARMSFTAMQAENPDIIGWIAIDGLGVDYPIVQSTDNSYYLKYTAQRRPSDLGALFMDYRNHRDFSDFNSVVYGHYKKTGKMFGQLKRLRTQANFDKVTEGILYTPGKTYRLEIFAAVLADRASEFYQYIFPDPRSREAHLDMIRAQAVCYRSIDVAVNDRLLVLSTCSYEYEGARTLVIAKIAE